MSLLQSYLCRRLGLPCLVVFISLLLLLGVFRLARVLSLAAATDGSLPPLLLFWLLKLLEKCDLLLPLALFLGLLYGLSRLASDGEWVACGSFGLGLWARLRAACLVALPVALLSAFLGLYVAPRAEHAAAQTLHLARSALNLSKLHSGVFHHLGDAVLYLEQADPNDDLQGVRLYLRGTPPTLLVAERARVYGASWAGARRLEFFEGTEYRGLPDPGALRVSRFRAHWTWLPGAAALPLSPPAALAGLTRPQWQWRLAPAVSCLVLALLAVALVGPLPGLRWYARALLSIALLLLYHNLLAVGRLFLERGWWEPWPGLWAVHALFALGAAAVLARSSNLHRGGTGGAPPVRDNSA